MVKKTESKKVSKKAAPPPSDEEEASEAGEVQYATKPQSAFFMFAADHRPRLFAEQGEKKDVGAVAKAIGKLWAECSEADKAPYQKKADKDKERYEKELASGLQKKPNKSKKDKKEKKKKDPNAPKRPQSAYFLWLGKNRESIIKEYKLDKGKVAEVVKKAGELWKDVDQKTKDTLQKQVEKAKIVYVKEKAAYDAAKAA